MEKEIRILIDEVMFDKLVSGEVLEIGNVKIALQDIGYSLMIEIILKKMKGMYVLNLKEDDTG